MAEPLSFVASVVAVAALAEKVVTGGYRYLKAVKNCPDEVRNLMAETNVLCGILGRLTVLLGGNRSKSETATKLKKRATWHGEDNDESSDEEGAFSSENEIISASDNTLHPPDFIYECQKTLHEIENVLEKFQHTAIDKSRFKITKFRRIEPKDLKWPLRKSQTMRLIEALERHKSTCTLALAENGLAGVHTVLEQTKFSNSCLANLVAKQEKLFELNVTHEQEESLAWLSSINPASKLQGFRRDRQPGTGRWLFDLPEMFAWLENPNSALWIHGIPGAGKTILSTLVVDEVLTRKRSSSIGTAYFYVRHDDKNSQLLSNILGSLISQLARQNSAALEDVVELHKQHRRHGSLTMNLDDDDLIRLLFDMSKYFLHIFIMIDGLDECGSPLDRDRKRLIDALAQIHCSRSCDIHMLIFSRDVLDIRKRLTAIEFQIVSIAARSADLRLYVNAWLPSLDIRSETLKVEVVDSLVEKAHGMFMWVRAQVDYLQRLPTDKEKRQALKTLPPDLPQTYVHILEIVDRTYPPQTTKLIQRLLKWLVLHKSGIAQIYGTSWSRPLNSEILSQAICIENESDEPSDGDIPTEQQILGWLGCLIRKSKSEDTIELAHFTVKEFLRMDPENISSAAARSYMVQPEDYNYMLKVCLTHLMHSKFRNTTCTSVSKLRSFSRNHPLYVHATFYLCDYIRELTLTSTGMNQDVKCIMQAFLSVPVHEAFLLWDMSNTGLNMTASWKSFPEADVSEEDLSQELQIKNFMSPLHFASLTGLVDEVQKLCREGLDPNCTGLPTHQQGFAYTPLHLALLNNAGASRSPYTTSIHGQVIFCHLTADYIPNEIYLEQKLQTIRTLLHAGANVHQQLIIDSNGCGKPSHVTTPLSLAFLSGFWQVACVLLDEGADCDAVPSENPRGLQDLCSINRLLKEAPELEESVQRVVDLGRYQSLKRAFERWQDRPLLSEAKKLGQLIGESIGHSMDDITYSASSQARFIDAYQNGNWFVVRELLKTESGVEINHNDEQGTNLLNYISAGGSSEDLRYFLERGANPNFLPTSGRGVLSNAIINGYLENMNLFLEFGANIEHQDPGGWTPFLYAIWCGRHEMVKRLLNAGANPDAVLDIGTGGIVLAIEKRDTDMFSLLLERGLNPASVNNYGSTPLHMACHQGLQFETEKLLEATTPDIIINAESLLFGTPLYAAAKQGFVSIVRTLLDAGAAIDQTGPGNVLGSALMVACAHGHGDTVQLLLSRGASREVEGSRFLTAVGTARAFRQEKIVEILEGGFA